MKDTSEPGAPKEQAEPGAPPRAAKRGEPTGPAWPATGGQVIDFFGGEHAFLSNFHISPVEVDGQVYPSGEHAFQALKATNEQDRRLIQEAHSPAQAKRIGRRIAMRSDWATERDRAMARVVEAKFGDTDLAVRLLETGDACLIEGNDWGDAYWGACRDHAGSWVGENRLGQILMALRARLRSTG